ncbi:MAG TPA: type I-E CRISPR-associated protein Cas6/Cse3/CasE [Gemmatimonadaceae bacterium]|nr:type I-E CRISPR-associated protein Cas6/Cse3/CasE [Gemmatimonadaceae bacterium]
MTKLPADVYLSRARLRRDVPSSALRTLLVPSDDSARVSAGHKLVWTLFGDSPGRERDFLWREAQPGVFYFLSRRPPEDRHGFFDLDPVKPFAPSLRAGDRLAFALRANATIARGGGPGVRGKPCDVVMDALHSVPSGKRAEVRQRAVNQAGLEWLGRQGEKSGFLLPRLEAEQDTGSEGATEGQPVRVMGYRTLRVDHGRKPARLGILDFEGVLEVCDPDAFVAAIARGFGRAKAFGCGLMLVRRA